MSIVFDALVTSDSLVFRPRDSAAAPGVYLPVASVRSGDDVQSVGLSGPTASGNLTLAFNGQTTANIPFTAAPPASFATFSGLPVTPGTAHRISIPVVPSPGFYTDSLHWEVIDGGTVTLAGTFDLGAITTGSTPDFTLANPSGGASVRFFTLAPAYVPASSTISVRFSVSDGTSTNWWDVDALDILPAGGSHTPYDDADATHFTSSGSASVAGTGSDNRFWEGGFARFQGGSQAGMAYSIDPAAMQAALRALSSVGAGNCVVTAADGSGHTPLTVEFTGALGAEAQPAITSATPGVTFPSHVVGGVVPSIVETLHDGTALASIPLKGRWICAAGAMSGAVLPVAGLFTPDATSSYAATVPAGPDAWMTTASGDVTPGTGTAANRVGGLPLVAVPAAAKTLKIGTGVLGDSYSSECLEFLDLAARITTFPLGSWDFGGNLALDADLYPTFISPNGSFGIVTEPTGESLHNNPLGPANAPNGLYTFYWDGPAGGIVPGGDSTTGTGVTPVEAYPDALTGTTGNRIVRNVQADPSKSRSPKFIVNWGASGPETTFNGNPALPCATKNLRIYPPDPSDPTGMTPWLNPTGKWHPSFDYMLRGLSSIRVDQAMNAITNPYADFADIRTDSQLGRNDFVRQVQVGVVSCQQYTGPAKDGPDFLQILVTCSSPHTLFSGAIINLNGCGNATFSDGHNFDIDIHTGLGFGVITVLDATTFVWHAGQSLSQTQHVAMTNVTTGGYFQCFPGTGWTINDCCDRCNATGADLWFNVSVCATDACIDAIADAIAARLSPGLKVRFELGDETWNTTFKTYSWMRIRNFQELGLSAFSSAEATAHDQNNLNVRARARFAAAGRAGDVVFIMPSMDGVAARTTDLLAYAAAQSPPYRIDEVPIAPYYNSIPADTGTLTAAQSDALPVGAQFDILEIWLDSVIGSFVAPHRAAIDAIPAYAGTPTVTYEGGCESLAACLDVLQADPSAINSPTHFTGGAYPVQHAMHRSPRIWNCNLIFTQRLQDAGVTLFTKFYSFAEGALAAYAGNEFTGQLDGTGAPGENPDPEALGPGLLSQDMAAFHHWQSLATGVPTLTCSPTTASAVDASTTVPIVPTLVNSTAALTVSVLSGGGSVPSGPANSGQPTVYLPPASGTGSAVVRFVDPADGLHADCTIAYAPASPPAPPGLPVRIGRIRPFRRLRRRVP